MTQIADQTNAFRALQKRHKAAENLDTAAKLTELTAIQASLGTLSAAAQENLKEAQAVHAEKSQLQRKLSEIIKAGMESLRSLRFKFITERLQNLTACDVSALAEQIRHREDALALDTSAQLWLVETGIPDAREAVLVAKVSMQGAVHLASTVVADISETQTLLDLKKITEREGRIVYMGGAMTDQLRMAAFKAGDDERAATEELNEARKLRAKCDAQRTSIGMVTSAQVNAAIPKY